MNDRLAQFMSVERLVFEPNGRDAARKGTVTECLADVEMKRVDWLWPGRLALGKATLLAGASLPRHCRAHHDQ